MRIYPCPDAASSACPLPDGWEDPANAGTVDITTASILVDEDAQALRVVLRVEEISKETGNEKITMRVDRSSGTKHIWSEMEFNPWFRPKKVRRSLNYFNDMSAVQTLEGRCVGCTVNTDVANRQFTLTVPLDQFQGRLSRGRHVTIRSGRVSVYTHAMFSYPRAGRYGRGDTDDDIGHSRAITLIPRTS